MKKNKIYKTDQTFVVGIYEEGHWVKEVLVEAKSEKKAISYAIKDFKESISGNIRK